MKLYNKAGLPIMDISSMELEGDRIVIKAKVATMDMVVYLAPEQLWEARELVKGKIWHLARLMWKGRKLARQKAKTAAEPSS